MFFLFQSLFYFVDSFFVSVFQVTITTGAIKSERERKKERDREKENVNEGRRENGKERSVI